MKKLFRQIIDVTEKESKCREVEESLNYLMNNWKGIIIHAEEAGAVWGCHAEGQVSHVLSSRMSSRPMGWSRKGADQMSRLRAYRISPQGAMTKPWLPSSDGWLPITDWVALFYEIGWLCHLRIFIST